jgi:hypothetical protein
MARAIEGNFIAAGVTPWLEATGPFYFACSGSTGTVVLECSFDGGTTVLNASTPAGADNTFTVNATGLVMAVPNVLEAGVLFRLRCATAVAEIDYRLSRA